MIGLPDKRHNLNLKTAQAKTIEKVEKVLSDLQKIKTEHNSSSTSIARAITSKGKEVVKTKDSNSDSSSSSPTDFQKSKSIGKLILDMPEVKRFVGKPNPMTFTKNWYSKPTLLGMQFEEPLHVISQTQFPIFANRLYEWNIDGLSKQEVLNKMNHMSMVANAYVTNHNLDHAPNPKGPKHEKYIPMVPVDFSILTIQIVGEPFFFFFFLSFTQGKNI